MQLRKESLKKSGLLTFVSKCVRPGRLFLCRILDTLRSLRRNHHRIKLNSGKISVGGFGFS